MWRWQRTGFVWLATRNSIMSSIPARLMGKPSPKGEQSTLTLTLAMLFFLISKQLGKQSNSLFIAVMKLLFRLLVDYLGGSAVSYFLKIWGTSSLFLISPYLLLNYFPREELDCRDKGVSKSTTSISKSSHIQNQRSFWLLPQCRTVSEPSWNCYCPKGLCEVMSGKVDSQEVFLLNATPRRHDDLKQKGKEMVQRTLGKCWSGIFRGTTITLWMYNLWVFFFCDRAVFHGTRAEAW